MTTYQLTCSALQAKPRRWLVTGVAGFIGSHILEKLLSIDQVVVGLDNFATGDQANLDEVRSRVSAEQWSRFTFREGTVADVGTCREAAAGCDFVLHQAGFVSVPLSIEDPEACHATNVTGTLNILIAAREAGVRRVVYASSSAVYGDDTAPAKIEVQIGRPLSPYGAAKYMTEIYARQFFDHYGLQTVGLRYFNVFGPRQNPTGGYAAVIPQWISRCVRDEGCMINGNGGITRDFCPVANVVQANILAATNENPAAAGQAFNVALGGSTTLDRLHELIAAGVSAHSGKAVAPVAYGPSRPGDIIHSSADISLIRSVLGYEPEVSLQAGLAETIPWYASR